MKKFRFLLRTAINDSKKNRARLFLFMSSIVLGITALVAINSFNYNLVKDIDAQSKTLLGADLQVSSNKELPENLKASLDSLPGERASEKQIFSMAYIDKTESSQFVRIKAIEGAFPFYGKINTSPENIGFEYQNSNGAIVADGLMLEHDLEIGDSIQLGEQKFEIQARLKSLFGSVDLGSGFAPAVYIGLSQLEETRLIQPGSIVNYFYYHKLGPEFDTEEWENNEWRKKAFRSESFRLTTIEDQQRNLNQAFSGLNSFLNLIALVSLILGCIGVASSVFIYIRSKIPSIAVLRCLGVKPLEAFWIYFIQISILGFFSVLLGAFFGSLTQIVLPEILKDILPYEVNLGISAKAIMEGLIIGSVVTALFAVIPLLSIRNVSPLKVLRASFEEESKRDFLVYIFRFLLVLSVFLFLLYLTKEIEIAISFSLALILSFLILYLLAGFSMWFVKKSFPRNWSFVTRQGLSNLFRPNNQTRTLIVSIGLGTSILTVLFIIQGLLLSNVASMDAGSQPNVIVYGIETSQKDSVAQITREFDMPVTQEVPIVTMRLAGWKGKTKAEWLADTTRTASRWAINREARVSYRDTLESDEKLLKGQLIPYQANGDSIFISMEDGFAEALDVEIGDELVWNVQGAMITTYLGSLRQIEFRSMRTRFFILFPEGVLEKAPQFHVLVSKSPNNNVMAEYRTSLVKSFPNISVVDLGSILTTLNDILNKVSYVIKFMAGFSILTGIIVLISSLLLSKFQRVRESVILRTIGARTEQLIKIYAVEYLILGSVSALTGIIIALVSTYLLCRFMFELDFYFNIIPLIGIFIFIISLTLLIGILNSRDVINKSPLEVLRKEV